MKSFADWKIWRVNREYGIYALGTLQMEGTRVSDSNINEGRLEEEGEGERLLQLLERPGAGPRVGTRLRVGTST